MLQLSSYAHEWELWPNKVVLQVFLLDLLSALVSCVSVCAILLPGMVCLRSWALHVLVGVAAQPGPPPDLVLKCSSGCYCLAQHGLLPTLAPVNVGEFCGHAWLGPSPHPALEQTCRYSRVSLQVPYRICAQTWFSQEPVGTMAQPCTVHLLS